MNHAKTILYSCTIIGAWVLVAALTGCEKQPYVNRHCLCGQVSRVSPPEADSRWVEVQNNCSANKTVFYLEDGEAYPLLELYCTDQEW
jgi:hypothetical protein